MSISFPNISDVTLKEPPLVKVVCQIRFTPILEIAGDKLAEYQELLRKKFPKFANKTSIQFDVKGIRILQATRLPNEFIFETADGLSNAALGVDFVAFSTKKYSSWQVFESDLGFVLNAFEQVYGSALATRIGLRYINELQFANTKTDSLNDLVNFLNPDLLKFENKTWGVPEKTENFVLFREEEEFLALRTRIVSVPKPQVTLDYDYYAELDTPTERNKDSVLKIFSRYHQVIYNAFRWSIREKRINIFQPIEKEF